MGKISSGISDFDNLTDLLYTGDNIVWEVEAGTSYEIFVHNFIRQSLADNQNVIYVSFNKSPQSILLQLSEVPYRESFVLLDCFTSGKGKNDRAFMKFYEHNPDKRVVKVERPYEIAHFTNFLHSIADNLPASKYIFDSLTGMQDLWGDESSTYKFFTYLCPRLYDLGTVAYWILEKEAHSHTFKANLRHITQVVLELYRRKDRLYIKALKLDGRHNREAFKPHPYEIDGKTISIKPVRKEPTFEVGTKIKELRTTLGMSQKELAEKVDLTPSFISQLENNQISPSLSSFIQICSALGVNPTAMTAMLEEKKSPDAQWLIKKERIFSSLSLNKNGLKGFKIVKNGDMSSTLIVLEPYSKTESDFIPAEGTKLVYVLKGNISVVINGREETLRSGDAIYLKEEVPSLWKNEGGDKTEILVICS